MITSKFTHFKLSDTEKLKFYCMWFREKAGNLSWNIPEQGQKSG
jgi:hypothetical protein